MALPSPTLDTSDTNADEHGPEHDEHETIESLAGDIATMKSNHAIALMRLQSRLKALLAAESRRANAAAKKAAKQAAQEDRDARARADRDAAIRRDAGRAT